MVVSRRWALLIGCFSLCGAAIACQARGEEAEATLEVDGVVVEVNVEEDAGNATAAAVDAEKDSESAKKGEKSTGAKPTHKQSAIININAEGLAQASVQCFCLTRDGQLLAGCSGSTGEIRVFDADGKFVKTIELDVSPEAINVAPDGTVLVAGEGELLRLSAEGEVVAQADSPHAEAIRESEAKIREQVIEEHKQQVQMLPEMLKTYDTAIEAAENQIETLESQKNSEAEIEAAKQTVEAYKMAKKQMTEQYGEQDGKSAELTDDRIAELVKSSMQYKIKVASISSDGESVYIACGMPAGYGYEVWKLSPELTSGESIVSGLSGCCGQMDVQASKDGVFVAENSRKRVRRFDASGKSICDWGKSGENVGGFGSCCNPMNLAFGSDGAVYTAEDTTGRIKRYSPDGKLMSVIGAADVVPGCKKVSIGVDESGDRVYMLDITKNNVAVLTRVLPDPTGPINEDEGGSLGGSLLRMIFGS